MLAVNRLTTTRGANRTASQTSPSQTRCSLCVQGKNPLILLEWEDFNFYKIEISPATEGEDKTSSEPVIKSEEEESKYF